MGRAQALIVALVAGCGSGSAMVDAGTDVGPDSPIDADLIDHDVSGTLLDWDSTASAPCPIAGATWIVYYGGGRMATTDASGNFTIKLTVYLPRFDLQPPVTAASCAGGTYDLPGQAFASGLIQTTGVQPVMRAMTAARVTTFYSAIGAPFDATRGQLFVHLVGPPRAVTISSSHDATQAFDGSTWSAGTSGGDVYVPNIDLTTSKWTTVSVAGTATGTGSVELVAGTIVYITIITS